MVFCPDWVIQNLSKYVFPNEGGKHALSGVHAKCIQTIKDHDVYSSFRPSSRADRASQMRIPVDASQTLLKHQILQAISMITREFTPKELMTSVRTAGHTTQSDDARYPESIFPVRHDGYDGCDLSRDGACHKEDGLVNSIEYDGHECMKPFEKSMATWWSQNEPERAPHPMHPIPRPK